LFGQDFSDRFFKGKGAKESGKEKGAFQGRRPFLSQLAIKP
jgi:hypothetical protein